MFQVTRTADGLGMTFTYNLWLDAAGLCEGDSELISQVGDPEALRLPRQACATAARCQTLSQAAVLRAPPGCALPPTAHSSFSQPRWGLLAQVPFSPAPCTATLGALPSQSS